ncbi:TIGR04197 family type VII secretion effector [Streptococcus merionis]|uniref:TIGR04197 family type VII secretion effector n=1 Tax=Streptococcus merionis TaxID=400065 RepID=UPI003512AC0F
MVVLQNDIQTAGENAASLAKGISSLTSSGTVTKDNRSRIGGNDRAKSVIDASYDVSKAISQAIEQMSHNIRSVSSEFEAMDKQLGTQLQQLERTNSMEFSLNG